MGKYKIKPVSRSSSNKRGTGATPSNFTSAEAIKNNFLAHTSIRQAQSISNDGSYWAGGRCEWGGSHNLIEDCQILANFANSTANINNDIQELSLAVNEQEFNSHKQKLVNKIQECIGKCQTTSASSIGGVCIIWNDFFGSFLQSWLNGFRQQLQSQLNQLQNIQPTHQKEILQLEAEIRAAEAKYNDAMTKAATETDPVKKAQFIAIAQNAEREVKQAKQKLARNPLSRLAEYNHLNNIGNLIKGNLPSQPAPPKNNPSPDPDDPGENIGGGQNNPNGGWIPRTPWNNNPNPNAPQQSSNQQLLIFGAIALLVIFFLMNQKQTDHDY